MGLGSKTAAVCLGLAVLGEPAAASSASLAAVQAACAATSPPTQGLSGYKIVFDRGAEGDLPYVESRSVRTGATVRIYHDPDLAQQAASKAACLGALMDLLAPEIPDQRQDFRWSAMLLTRDVDREPSQRRDDARWANPMPSGAWDHRSMEFLIRVMPHEQVHLSQKRRSTPLPRWFEEGHAEWAGLHVTEKVRPDLAQQRRRHLAAALADAGDAHLREWGGLKVKQEAIDRQLSPEDRAMKAADPNYKPAATMRFKPGDFYKDEVNLDARYGAALAVFDQLEARHGRAAVQAWVLAVLAEPDDARIAPLAKEMLGEDIIPLLN